MAGEFVKDYRLGVVLNCCIILSFLPGSNTRYPLSRHD
jgi:hypothetical protein